MRRRWLSVELARFQTAAGEASLTSVVRHLLCISFLVETSAASRYTGSFRHTGQASQSLTIRRLLPGQSAAPAKRLGRSSTSPSRNIDRGQHAWPFGREILSVLVFSRLASLGGLPEGFDAGVKGLSLPRNSCERGAEHVSQRPQDGPSAERNPPSGVSLWYQACGEGTRLDGLEQVSRGVMVGADWCQDVGQACSQAACGRSATCGQPRLWERLADDLGRRRQPHPVAE